MATKQEPAALERKGRVRKPALRPSGARADARLRKVSRHLQRLQLGVASTIVRLGQAEKSLQCDPASLNEDLDRLGYAIGRLQYLHGRVEAELRQTPTSIPANGQVPGPAAASESGWNHLEVDRR